MTTRSNESENEDNNNMLKSEVINCDSPTNFSDRSGLSRHGSRSRSSSPEIDVDSPSPPRLADTPPPTTHKKFNGFSVSALLNKDDKDDKIHSNPFKAASSFTPIR